MSDKCSDIERIAEVLELPIEDPRRRHVEACPRCGAILASYQAFMKEALVPGSDPEGAHERLTAFIASHVEAPGEEYPFEVPEKARGRGGFLSRIMGILALRPAWAAALVVLVVALLAWWRPWTPDEIVLRGVRREGATQPLTLRSPQSLSHGFIRLEWAPMAGADAYEVRFYDKSLKEIARLGPTKETALIVDQSTLPAGTPHQLIWRVFALERGDEVGSSDPAPLDLRLNEGE